MRGADYLLSFCFCRDKDERHFWFWYNQCSVCCSVDMLCQVDNEMCEIFLGQENIFLFSDCVHILFVASCSSK